MTSVIMAAAVARPSATLADRQSTRLGGSRIVYRVNSDSLREAVVADPRDDVYRILREDKVAFSDLAIRDGGVELKVADARSREQFARRSRSPRSASTAAAHAHITAEKRRNALRHVLDDRVISAPVIREPITGGSGQISGNFTLEEANSVAMMLRAGSLPGPLGLVEQQVVRPAAKP